MNMVALLTAALLMVALLMVALLMRDIKKHICMIADEYDSIINDRVMNA